MSDSEGAHTAISCNETTLQALELIVVLTSSANFQLIVDLFLIQNCEGAREVPITHYSASEGDRSQSLSSASDKSITFSLKNIHVQQLIVVHQSRHRECTDIKGSVNHFTHAAQQELQVYCGISLFQNIPSLQQRFHNIL